MKTSNHIVRYRPIITAVAVSLTLINGLPGARRLSVNGTTGAAGSVSAHQIGLPGVTPAGARNELLFEPNVGQAPEEARFIARGQGYNLMLTADGAVIGMYGRRTQSNAAPATKTGMAPSGRGHLARAQALLDSVESIGTLDDQRSDSVASDSLSAGAGRAAAAEALLRFRFTGASGAGVISGVDKLAATTNYLKGSDPAGWHSGVPNYAKVRYQGIYDGIDLIYYGSGADLEYDVVLSPGADPNIVQFEADGAASLTIDSDGQLVVETPAGQIRQKQPQIYQMVDGVRRQVEGGYRLLAPLRAGFSVGQYDRTRELVIDPSIVYTTTLGGSRATFVDAIAVDPQGNSYVSGGTTSPDFPTKNPLDGSLKGPQDAFITKLDPKGNIVYSTFLGGSGIDEAFAIAVDSAGSVFAAGATSSSDFPTTSAAFQKTTAGNLDAFVAKLSPNGGALVYSTLFGGSGDDLANGIGIGTGQGLAAGSVVIAGVTSSPNLPVKNAFQQSDKNAKGTGFVTAIDPTGGMLIYSSYLGGSGADSANGIAMDSQGNAYLVGTTASLDFPTTAGAFQTKLIAPPDVFVSVVSPAGALRASTYLGGAGSDQGVAIALAPAQGSSSSESAGRSVAPAASMATIWVAVNTTSNGLPTSPAAFQGTRQGQACGFLCQMDAGLQTCTDGTYIGGSGSTTLICMDADNYGQVCVGGLTNAPDYPSTNCPNLPNPNPGKDNACCTLLGPDGQPGSSCCFSEGPNNSDLVACKLDSVASQTGLVDTGLEMDCTVDSATDPNAEHSVQTVVGDLTQTCDVTLSTNEKVVFGAARERNAPLQGVVSGVSECLPIVTSNDDWIKIQAVQFYQDAGTFFVRYELAENTSSDPRYGSFRVGDKVITVVQAGSDPLPPISILPTSTLSGSNGITIGATPAGHSDSVLTVQAAGFSPTSVIGWNGESRPTTVVSGNQLTAQISAQDLSTPGTVQITVFDPAPGGGTSPPVTLTITQGPDFSLSLGQPTTNGQAGAKARVAVTINRLGGFHRQRHRDSAGSGEWHQGKAA
jgi:hypothetical protein